MKVLSPTFQTFLSWFNMDMGVPTCFFKGMTTFSSVLLEGAFPLYLWLVAFTVVVLSNKNVRLTRFLGENPVQVVATLILLTYSKMLRVALSALRYTNIYVFDKEGHHTTCMWYLDSTVMYLRSAEHITLFIIAILFITVTFPFTVSLLCIRNTFKLSNYCRCFSFIDKLKPFFDAYTGPFNNRSVLAWIASAGENNNPFYHYNTQQSLLLCHEPHYFFLAVTDGVLERSVQKESLGCTGSVFLVKLGSYLCY